MVSITRVKQAISQFVKVLRYGENDVQTSGQFLPFGIDSKPIKDMLAAQSTTSNREDTIIFGYLIESEETEEGETRIYSADATGETKFYIKLLRDGTCEIGGDVDNLVRFEALDQALQTFITDLNTNLVSALGAVGGSWPGTSLDITGAKIEEVKTL